MDWSTCLLLNDRWMPHLFSSANVVQSKFDQVADAKLAERIIDSDAAVCKENPRPTASDAKRPFIRSRDLVADNE
jgi:hypothetical protein